MLGFDALAKLPLASAPTLSDRIGALSVTEADDTLSATAVQVRIVGSLSQTEAADTLSATGTLPIVGTLAALDSDDTLESVLLLLLDLIAEGGGQDEDDTLSATAKLVHVIWISSRPLSGLITTDRAASGLITTDRAA